MDSEDPLLSNPTFPLDQKNLNHPDIQNNPVSSSHSNIFKVIYIGLALGILHTAFNGFQALIIPIYNDLGYKYMGELTLLVQYIVTLIAGLISPTVVKGWSYKFGVTLCSLGFITPAITVGSINSCSYDPDHFYCSGAIMSYVSNVGSAVGIGISVPAFWLSASRYVNSFTNAQNKGAYFGVFWSLMAAAQISGSFLCYFLIRNHGRTVYFMVCGGFGIATTLMLLLSAPAPKYYEDWAGETSRVKAKRIIGLALNTKMKYLVPFIFFASFAFTLNNGFQYRTILDSVNNALVNEQSYMNIFIFVLQGFFGVLSCYIAGKQLDMTNEKNLSSVFNYTYDFAILFSLLAYFLSSLALAYIMGSLWGFGFSGSFVLIFVLAAKEFNGTIEIFAVVQIVMTLGGFVGTIVGVALRDQVPAIIFITLGFLIVSQVMTGRFFRAKEETKEVCAINRLLIRVFL